MTKTAKAEPPAKVVAPLPGGSRGPRSPGRVADLEAHVRPEWWRLIFDDLYLKTDGDVFENDENTRREVDELIAAARLHPSDRVLDLCCGQGRHAIELARRGFANITGVDQSAFLLGLARERARAAHLDIAFIEADARACRIDADKYDCVAMLGNSFGYFQRADDDAALLRQARRALHKGGRLVLDLVEGDWLRTNFQPRSWEWLEDRMLICRERSLSADGERLVTREIVLGVDCGVIDDRFFAERLYSRSDIAALLEDEGFRAVSFIEPSELVSDRDSDLGMMARRLLVVARAAGERSLHPPRPAREVLVVMGDPRLPDPVKPNGRFGPADRRTIERLRTALAELSGYRFRYIDDHATLADRLRTARPDFVFNLCDEGYGNDAAMEAHVPALLDMFRIAYTGAGPACLSLCYDKAVVRSLAASLGMAVPDEVSVAPDDNVDTLPARFPALIKPCLGDNSVGIDARSVVGTPAGAAAAVQRLRRLLPGRPVLVQEYLTGAEYSLGVIGNPGRPFELLPLLEVDYSALEAKLPRILAYGSKWDPASPYAKQIRYRRSALPEASERLLAEQALRLFERLGCRDYARFDFRADAAGQIKLLEVNPNPGWSWDSKLAIMAGFARLAYRDLLRLILEAAQARLSL